MTARMTTAEFQAEALRLTMQALDRACESHQPLRDVFEAEASERLAQLSQHFAALLDELEQLEAAVSLALDASRGCCGEFETGSDEHGDECAGRTVTVVLAVTEHCDACHEDFTAEQLKAFDPSDNDHCPKCDARGAMTTLYGRADDSEYRGGRLKDHELDALAESISWGPTR